MSSSLPMMMIGHRRWGQLCGPLGKRLQQVRFKADGHRPASATVRLLRSYSRLNR